MARKSSWGSEGQDKEGGLIFSAYWLYYFNLVEFLSPIVKNLISQLNCFKFQIGTYRIKYENPPYQISFYSPEITTALSLTFMHFYAFTYTYVH